MLKSFEAGLHRLNDIAKAKANHESTLNQREKTEEQLDAEIQKLSRENITSERTQEAIFKQQKRKQKIMTRLKQELADIDNPFAKEVIDIDAKVIRCIDGRYCYREKDDVREVTLGELLTDGDWGIKYHLDPSSMPRNVRKKFVIEQAKRELMSLLDRQIVVNETQTPRNDEKKKKGYENMIAPENQEQSGKLAEKMVKNMLKRMTIDFDLDLDIIDADAYEDMELKSDFLVIRKSMKRGVKVDSWEGRTVGIQFASTTDPEILRKKKIQVEKAKKKAPEMGIQDVALVAIPLNDIQPTLRKWKEKRVPGGPEKLWSRALQEEIFRKVMRGFLTQEEIDSAVKTIESGSMRAAA